MVPPEPPPRPVNEALITGMGPAMDRAATLLDAPDRGILASLLRQKRIQTDWGMRDDVLGQQDARGIRLHPDTSVGMYPNASGGLGHPRDIEDMAATLVHELQHSRQGPFHPNPEGDAQRREHQERQRWKRSR